MYFHNGIFLPGDRHALQACHRFQIEASPLRNFIVYVILPIALVGFLLTWPLLRRFTRIWVRRSITTSESLAAGTIAWLFLLSLVAWFGGIVLTLVNYILNHNIIDIGILLLSILLTGFVMNYFNKSRYELRIDEAKDFFKGAIQFRHSRQQRLDLPSLMRQGRDRNKRLSVNDSESRQRERLQADLEKEKEQDTQLTLLREGTIIDMSELWRLRTQTHSSHPLYEKVQEVRIDPGKKRLSLYADFPELNEEQLKDETTVLRFNRQVYDFFQFLNADPWLKPYSPFFESYFLMCRATKKISGGAELMYPFMKVGALVSELHMLEGSYFNPRKLSEITTLAFNSGAQV